MRNKRTHRYTQNTWEQNFALEPIEEGTKNYMTGQGRGIECGDHIVLQSGSDVTRYQVEAIDYYSDPSDMWVALLIKVS